MSRLVDINITPISTTPDVVTLQQAKDYCRVDFDDDDSLFSMLISTSRQRLEQYTCRVFLKATCKALYTQEGCGDRILLSYSDNLEKNVTGQYNDKLFGESWIDTCDKVVLFEYKAGFAAGEVPEWMKLAVLMDIAYRYENRGDVAANTGINIEVKEFLKPYVNWSML